ncbi:MucBP domain-containing protein [Convivina intestini]|uniref:MucBP-like protein n=1 Tax=Convivina intestini TaxID=1505726 RepID=A0A2U1D563_9LACO|nr:MucBP domain-containing protein [Convivina intestini]PVY82815.1 MucBP-like protein [Convivina intestini]CAH1856787.1 hypothetical protein R077811_01329 [Convivina intestini]SDC15784.1 MucBP domain-containing protein [Leuconostocaceae bacterium R-53105]
MTHKRQVTDPNASPVDKLGHPADWAGSDSGGQKNRPYGAFVSTDDNGRITIDDGSKQAAGENRTPKRIPFQYTAPKRWSTETDFSIDFDATTRMLTIRYGDTTKDSGGAARSIFTWTKQLSEADVSQPDGLAISASTGGVSNRQTFKLTSMDYYRAATVNVKYVDEAGNEIAKGDVTYPDGWQKGKTYQTKALDLSPNYKYLGLAPGSLPANGNLDDWGDNGTVTYLYHYITPAESTSTSQSNSSSKSDSISTSASQSESTKSASTSTSGSKSASESTSKSTSTSKSASESDSTKSASTSTSASGSKSAS